MDFMNKNTPGHKYYRSEEIMAKDLSIILAHPGISLKMKKDVVDSVLWKWTERFGKYEGCQCSPAAYEHYRLHGDKGLRHDHAIPRNILTKMFLEKQPPLTAPEVLNLLREFCVAVVITKSEDDGLGKARLRQKMPKGWNWTDPYARYKVAGIKVVKGRLSK